MAFMPPKLAHSKGIPVSLDYFVGLVQEFRRQGHPLNGSGFLIDDQAEFFYRPPWNIAGFAAFENQPGLFAGRIANQVVIQAISRHCPSGNAVDITSEERNFLLVAKLDDRR